MDINVPPGRTVQQQLAAGPAILDPGRRCTVSWQGNRAGPGNGLGNGLGDRPGLGNRVQVLWVTEFIKSLFYIKVSAAI